MEIGDWSGKIGDWSLGARRFFDLRRGVADRRRVRRLSNFAPKDWYEATDVCAAEGKVLCGVDTPCSRSGCSYDNHYQWTGEACQAGDAGLPAECA